MQNFKLTLCVLALAAISASASAADPVTQGTVTFNGELTADTCSISSDSIDRQVQLPRISTQTLNAAGTTAGSKGFDLNVESCPSGMTQVAAHFEAIGSSGQDSTTGNLTNQFTASGNDNAATNVQVRIYNSDEKQLKLGDIGAPAKVTGGKATMRYFGGYYATGATTAGKVYAQARYTLAYP